MILVAAGLLALTPASATAVSGSSSSGSSAEAQYTQGGERAPGAEQPQKLEVKHESAAPGDAKEDAQQPRQVAVGQDEELPFTGYLLIPLVAGGFLLLSTGYVLRRRARPGH